MLKLLPYAKYSDEKKKEIELNTKNDLACNFSNLYKFKESIEIHEELLEYYKSVGDVDGIQSAYHGIGICYLRNKESEKVVYYNFLKIVLLLIINLIKKAEKYFDDCLKILDENKNIKKPLARGQVFCNLGLIYKETDRNDEAYEATMKAIKVKRHLIDVNGLYKLLMQIFFNR